MHGIVKAILSVRLSVCLYNAWIVTKRKKLCPRIYLFIFIIYLFELRIVTQ